MGKTHLVFYTNHHAKLPPPAIFRRTKPTIRNEGKFSRKIRWINPIVDLLPIRQQPPEAKENSSENYYGSIHRGPYLFVNHCPNSPELLHPYLP